MCSVVFHVLEICLRCVKVLFLVKNSTEIFLYNSKLQTCNVIYHIVNKIFLSGIHVLQMLKSQYKSWPYLSSKYTMKESGTAIVRITKLLFAKGYMKICKCIHITVLKWCDCLQRLTLSTKRRVNQN